MPPFDLHLKLHPAFHRHCSIRIEGDDTGLATFEAELTGLLPRVVLTLPVESGHMAVLRARCLSMLERWDEQWSRSGLDGIWIDGMLDSSDSKPRTFKLWSPDSGNVAHAMLSAVLDCFPVEHCNGVTGELLEIVRSYLELQPPVIVIKEVPLRVRLAPWMHRRDAQEIEKCLSALPEDSDLIVDASGVERFGQGLANILPMTWLLKRIRAVHWIAESVDADALIAYGVEPSTIEIIHHPPISPMGHPIVLGGIVVSSPALVSLASSGTRIELVRAFRQEHRLTIEQASRAAGELINIVATNLIF